MSVVDLKPLLDYGMQVAAIVAVPLAGWLTDRAITLFEVHAHINLNTLQVSALHAAADTAAGNALTLLAQGEIKVEDLHVGNDRIAALARTAINAVPAAADAMDLTAPEMAHLIVGRVGAKLSADPTFQTVPTAPVPAAPAVAAVAIAKAA